MRRGTWHACDAIESPPRTLHTKHDQPKKRRTSERRLHDRVLILQILRALRLQVVREPLHVAHARARVRVRVACPPDDRVERGEVVLGLLEREARGQVSDGKYRRSGEWVEVLWKGK